jgi:hypothetical protein
MITGAQQQAARVTESQLTFQFFGQLEDLARLSLAATQDHQCFIYDLAIAPGNGCVLSGARFGFVPIPGRYFV